MAPSSTMIVQSGLTTRPISTISSKSSLSCRCRPEVSRMIRSNRSDLNLLTPCIAIVTGSVSVYLPSSLSQYLMRPDEKSD